MSQLFYSQVNSAVQSELVARGSVRTKNNSNAALDFMLGKIANVELQAYDAVPTAESKPIEGFGTLGGFTVLNGSYKSTDYQPTPSKSSCMYCPYKDKKDLCSSAI